VSDATLNTLLARFRDKVVVVEETGCWEWQAGRRSGYGRIRVDGKLHTAHRWAWEQMNGPVPTNRPHMDHFRYPGGCIGRGCVNPRHVRPTTARENTLRGDGVAAQRLASDTCVNGHLFDEENTRWYQRGERAYRECRACDRARNKDPERIAWDRARSQTPERRAYERARGQRRRAA
jgi:hypothetical protein